MARTEKERGAEATELLVGRDKKPELTVTAVESGGGTIQSEAAVTGFFIHFT